jgi:hypothetical protein
LTFQESQTDDNAVNTLAALGKGKKPRHTTSPRRKNNNTHQPTHLTLGQLRQRLQEEDDIDDVDEDMDFADVDDEGIPATPLINSRNSRVILVEDDEYEEEASTVSESRRGASLAFRALKRMEKR